MRGNFGFIWVVLLAALLVVAGCSQAPAEPPDEGSGEPETPAKTEIVIRMETDMLNIDPAQMRDSLSTEAAYEIYSSLVRLKPGSYQELVGDLAERWEVSDDGLVYTFYLRDDAKWQRGYGDVTAEDVRYSFMRHLDPEVGSRWLDDARNIKDVEVVDPYTVRVVMNNPYPDFLKVFAAYRPGFIVNKQAIEELGDRYTEQPVGSGAFMMEEWRPRESVTLVRNPDFYGDSGQFERITYMVIPDESVAEIALENGEVDISYFTDPAVQSRILASDKVVSQSSPAPRTYFITPNLAREPLQDKRVREAMAWAIDKDLLVEEVMNGMGQVTDTILNTFIFERLDERHFSYSPERARELLTEAGLPNGFSSTMLLRAQSPQQEMAPAIQDMWLDVGINVEIDMKEHAIVESMRKASNFDMTLTPNLRLGADQYLSFFHSDYIGGANFGNYSNPDFDRLLEEAKRTVDDNDRKELYHEIQRLLWEDPAMIPLLTPVFVLAHQPELQGAEMGLFWFNVPYLTWNE